MLMNGDSSWKIIVNQNIKLQINNDYYSKLSPRMQLIVGYSVYEFW